MYSRIINWNKKLSESDSHSTYSLLLELKAYFKDSKVSMLDLLEYAIDVSNGDNLYAIYSQINSVMDDPELKIPSQYNTTIRASIPGLSEVLRFIKQSGISHSGYAYMACMLFMQSHKLNSIKFMDYPDAFYGLPKWIEPILYRQYRLCKNARVPEDGPFFFYQSKAGTVNRRTINNSTYLKLFKSKYGYDYKRYVQLYATRIGLENNAAMLFGTNPDVLEEIRKRRRRNLYHPVGIYKKLEDRRKVRIHEYGACLKEVETGIYLVHAENDVYIVPFMLLDLPSGKSTRMVDFLRKEKYATAAEVEMMTKQSVIIKHKIKGKVLN